MIHALRTKPIMVGYRYGPALVDVEADDPDTARWLAEFLTPWFAVGAAGAGEFVVRLTCSSPAFAVFEHRQVTATCRPVACFTLDSRVISLIGWTEEDGSQVIADPEHGCFYMARGRCVEVVARPGVLRTRVGLMRVVRELAAARVLARQNISDFHAAAFAVGERAVLLVGAKRAGKTTLLANVLASGRASLLANDRVFVDTGRQPPRAFGMPTLLSIQEGTIQAFPRLRRHPDERPALLHADELKSLQAGRLDNDAPRVFALSPTQFAGRLDAPTACGAPIAAIVFPQISPTVDCWSLTLVDPTEGAARLRECFYGVHTTPRVRTLFEEFAGLDRAESPALVDMLVAQCPLFSCRLGPDAYRDGADAWLQALSRDSTCRT